MSLTLSKRCRAAEGAELLAALPLDAAADALEYMHESEAEQYVMELAPDLAVNAVKEMSPDDAADLLAELPEKNREEILAGLSAKNRAQLEELMAYAPDSAGGIMSPEVTALTDDLTVSAAINALRRIAEESEQLYYTYVVDEHKPPGGRSLVARPSVGAEYATHPRYHDYESRQCPNQHGPRGGGRTVHEVWVPRVAGCKCRTASPGHRNG